MVTSNFKSKHSSFSFSHQFLSIKYRSKTGPFILIIKLSLHGSYSCIWYYKRLSFNYVMIANFALSTSLYFFRDSWNSEIRNDLYKIGIPCQRHCTSEPFSTLTFIHHLSKWINLFIFQVTINKCIKRNYIYMYTYVHLGCIMKKLFPKLILNKNALSLNLQVQCHHCNLHDIYIPIIHFSYQNINHVHSVFHV